MPSGPAHPDAWKAFWRGVAKFQKSKINPAMALRNTLGVAAPLAIGAAVGQLGAGLVASTGALQVAFRDSDAPYADRARLMLAASVIAGTAVALGSMVGNHPAGAVALTAAWAFASGMLVALGQQAGDLGLMSLVLLVVYGALPLPPERAALAGLAAFAGGVLQTAFAVTNWLLDPRAPVRRSLGDLYLAISREVLAPAKATESPLATQPSIQAQNALQTLDADPSPESDRLRYLESQAERLRLNLLALLRLRGRLERDFSAPREREILDRFIAQVSRTAGAIGHGLKAGAEPAVSSRDTDDAARLAEDLRQVRAQPELAAMLHDARAQMDAIAGQLRSSLDVMRREREPGPEPITRVKAMRAPFWRDRALTLRANLSLESPAFRHAIRLAACIAIGETLARAAGVTRPYWLPMTIAIVLRPDFGSTFSRGVLRLIGTFAGIALATALVYALPESVWQHIAIVAALMFVVRSFGSANYGVFAMAITAMVVFLIWLNGVAPGAVIAARAINTAVGGVIALIAYWAWPTWERHRVTETLARMLDKLRDYFLAAQKNYTTPSPAAAEALERARIAGRLARSNFEASVERAVAEPGVPRESIQLLTAMVASSHRLAQALMALEAAISTAQGVRPRQAFHKFAADVGATLTLVSSALRGSPVEARTFPDLREDHHALVHSDESGELYGLVDIETDRITNALNTLAGEALEWTGSARS